MLKQEKNSNLVNFSYKSTFFILFVMLLASLVFPGLLNLIGLKMLPLRVVIVALAAGFSTAYAIFFIDSNKGISLNFWLTVIVISIISGIISYSWIYGYFYI